MPRPDPVLVKGRFVNPGYLEPAPSGRDMGFREFQKWRRERKPAKGPFHVPRADRRGPMPGAPDRGIQATWAGHSSVVLQMDGLTLLTDPVWSKRVGGVVPRLTAPGVGFEDLPRVDAVLVSHDHYDHLDAGTLKRLPRGTPIVCPTGVPRWFEARGFTDVRELTWWGATPLDGARVTLVPAQHFSGRTPWGRNRSLWGGFVVEGRHGATAWYAGDTGYHAPSFRAIGDAFPRIDLAIMPIGAYEPRWFMSGVHVDPAQAGEAFVDAGARHFLPVHWGTFQLADEALDEPPRALEAWWRERGLDKGRLLVPGLGETVTVPR